MQFDGPTVVVDLGEIRGMSSTASCGFCVPAFLGAIYQNATHLTRHVTDASSGGTRKVCWMRFFEHWSKT
jgi:hypothetical protein